MYHMQFSDFALPPSVLLSLDARGITTPTPIQEQTLPHSLEGKDILGRARTGTGKTLAFGLPIATRLEVSRERGRKPRALILTPTRELAKQIARELESSAAHLFTTTIYGGTSYTPQERDLQRGVDIVVGTPGRVIDHLGRGSLGFDELQIAVLDEADEMLSMGFQEAVEKILEFAPKDRQTMLFSATIPRWVDKLARGYLRSPIKVDLVGDENATQSTTTHLAIKVNPAARTRVLADLLTVQGPERAIIFTRTKRDCDELALELIHRGLEAEAIHGDLAQSQRERALEGFRAGRTRVLVATDVAARGLDVPDVELVVQHHFPNDSEAYIHRSGRTGRAGKSGVAVVLYTDREQRSLRTLEHETGVFFERRDAPKASDVGMAASRNAAKDVRSVPVEVTEPFMEEATALVEAYGAEEALARALAWIAGVHTAPKPASLITGEEGMTTLLLRAARLNVPRAVAVLAQASGLSSKALGKIKAFNGGVAADVPTHAAAALVALEAMDDIKIELATVLPELIEAPVRDSRYNDSRPRSSGGGNNRFQGNRDNYRPSNSNSSGSTSSGTSSSTSNASNSNSGGASRGGFSSGRPSDSRPGESRGFRARKKY